MNLTTDEAAKVIEALEYIRDYSRSTSPELTSKYSEEALAILQAAKDRPQPAVDRLIEAGRDLYTLVSTDSVESISEYTNRCERACKAWTAAESAAPTPQPAVDARAWLLSRGMWPEQLSSRINLGDTAQTPTMLELFTEFAAKSAAPVDAPKVLTDEVIERLRITREREEGRPASSKYGYGFRDGLRYARDNGYLAPVNPPKVLTDEEVIRLAEQASQDIGTQAAIVGVLKYARDNGYITPAKHFNV